MKDFSVRLAVDANAIEEVTAFAMVPNTMPVRLAMRERMRRPCFDGESS